MYKKFSVVETILLNCEAQSQAVAIDTGRRSYTYIEYVECAAKLSAKLQADGLGENDRIVTLIEQGEYTPIVLLAILMTGASYVPIDISWPVNRIEMVLEDLQASCVITERSCTHLSSLTLSSKPVFIEESLESSRNLDGFIARDAGDNDTAYIFYTSGSTGLTKGVELSYSNLHFYMCSAKKQYAMTSQDSHLSIAKSTFSISLFDVLLPFYCGGSLYMRERTDLMNPVMLSQWLKLVSCFHIGPSLLGLLAQHCAHEEKLLDNIRHISCGGDMVPAVLLEQCKTIFPNAEIWVIYGCTELACMALSWQVDRDTVVDTTYVGSPFDGVDIMLVDEELQPVEAGSVAEILISSAGVAQKYLNRDDLNREKFIDIKGHRYYRTGDMAVKESNGLYRLLGRKDFQIQINGVRIEEGEVEHWLKAIERIQTAIVVGAKGLRDDVRLVAFVVMKYGCEFNAEMIKQKLAEDLPDYMLPSRIILLETIPLNINGKVDRKAMIELAEENFMSRAVNLSDDSEVKNELIELWLQAGLTIIDQNCHFFESGGDSMTAADLAYRIHKAYSIHCDITDIYDHPRLLQLMIFIEDSQSEVKQKADKSSLVTALDDGTIKTGWPIFIVPGMGGYTTQFHHIGHSLQGDWKAYGLNYPEFFGETHNTFESVAKRMLEDIVAVQPEGPYFFCGHSLGGVLSFEMAKLLKQRDQKSHVVLLDARIWSLAPKKRNLFIWLRFYLTEESPIKFSKDVFKKLKSILQDFMQPDIVASSKEELFINVIDRAYANARKQAKLYQIKSADIPAVLIKCNANPCDQLRNWIEDYGWSRYVDLKSVLYSTGSHYGMLEKTNRQELAEKIEASINAMVPEGFMLKRI